MQFYDCLFTTPFVLQIRPGLPGGGDVRGVDPDVVGLGGDLQSMGGLQGLDADYVLNLDRVMLAIEDEVEFLVGPDHPVEYFIKRAAFH